MLQLKYNTPFAAQLALFPNQQGVDTLYIIVKATFNIGHQWTLADNQIPPLAEDTYWSDDPSLSSIKNASAYHLSKPSTDIIMCGHAVSRERQEVREMDVTLAVGKVNKTVRVFGDRQWVNGAISSPKLFSTMPLIYERAFGGIHIQDGQTISAEERNPIGRGFVGKKSFEEIEGQYLPNLEDPRKLMLKAGDIVNPANFSHVSPNWQPRISYAGTYDDNWKKNQAPYLPEDFDSRFFNTSHPDLIYPEYLCGGEPVKIDGIHPSGQINFTLPVVEFNSKVHINSRTEEPMLNMETLLIDADTLQLSMTWKAELACDKEALKIHNVVINLVSNQRRNVA